MDTPTPALSFDPSEEETLLRASLRQMLADKGAQESAHRFWLDDTDYDRALWRELTTLGLVGMAAPETLGGTDAPCSQLALVSEELGRACAAVPFEMHTLALVLLARLDAGALDQIIAAAARGEQVLTAALNTPALPEGSPARLGISADQRLTGTLPLVLEGAVADVVVVPIEPGGLALVGGGFMRQPVPSLGMNRFATLTFDATPAERLWSDSAAAERQALTLGALLYAARQAGVGDWLLRQTTDYAAGRVQFGRPIGSFQAIQHKLAEMHIALTAGRSLVRHAATRLDDGVDGRLEVARAKAFLDSALWQASKDAHQIHGGVGFMLDHPLHLYFAQSRGAEAAFGGPRAHQRAVGRGLLTASEYQTNRLLGA